MTARSKISSLFGLVIGTLLSVFGKSPGRSTAEDLRKMEFKTSTQRMGLRFTEKIREVFRFKWLRKY